MKRARLMALASSRCFLCDTAVMRRRHDLAALGDEALQQLHVLVVDLRRIGAGERAGLLAAEEGTALSAAFTPRLTDGCLPPGVTFGGLRLLKHCLMTSLMLSHRVGQAIAALLCVAAQTASAQQPDSTGRDSARVTKLETIEVTGSIAPTAGP